MGNRRFVPMKGKLMPPLYPSREQPDGMLYLCPACKMKFWTEKPRKWCSIECYRKCKEMEND